MGRRPVRIHLLVSIGREDTIAGTVKALKSGSLRWLHDSGTADRSFAWQAGYGAFTVSQSQIEDVTSYIRNQAEHHRRRSFQQEFRHLLRKHEIEFDERYVWD